MIAFFDAVRVARLSADAVATFGDPETLFLNVNTARERDAAERCARAQPDDATTERQDDA